MAGSVYIQSRVARLEPRPFGRRTLGDILEHSRFEKARIIGARALQLSMGAPPLIKVDNPEKQNPVDISMAEYAVDAIPLTVRRTASHQVHQ
jgi:DNA-directed RNA polymerase subunit K